jgi:glycosyltransferase involved in cell wall biosynthesis
MRLESADPAALHSGASAQPASVSGKRPIDVAVVGMSSASPCGVRAHAGLLAQGLGDDGVRCTELWLEREAVSPRAGWAEVGRWARTLRERLCDGGFDAVLLHYSVFAYSYRGLPLFVRPTMAALRASRLPVLGFMHELAYPWRLRDARGAAWAIAHRAALIDAMRTCAAVAVTTDFRADWLAGRRWLARRPLALAPVFSNLPPPTSARIARRMSTFAVERGEAVGDGALVGLFGYSYDELALARVLDAFALLAGRGLRTELALLGAPGRASALAERWLRAARARGIAESLRFAGPLPAQELSDALAVCDVLLFADPPGPSSRKGTLAGSLASGSPLVALDGPRTWPELVRAEAARVVAPSALALADALADLLGDEPARAALGARGRAFAAESMGVERSVEVVLGLLGGLIGEGRQPCLSEERA